MDILDFIINLLNLTDSENHIKKNWNILSDKNEYLGERIKSFFIYFTNCSLSFSSNNYNLFNLLFTF